MKHTTLCLALLATAAGSAGCGHCDPSDTVVVSTFQTAAGQSITSCSAAGVATLRFIVDGVPLQDVQCDAFVDGAALGISGQHTVGVQAFDTNGTLLYASSDNVSANRCGITVHESILTAQFGDLSVSYSFQGGGACSTPTAQSSASTTFIWFEIVDQNGQVASAVKKGTEQNSIPCGSGNNTFVVPNLPFGTYKLNGIEEVEILADNSIIVFRYNCAPSSSFQHAVAGDVLQAPAMIPQAAGGTVTCF